MVLRVAVVRRGRLLRRIAPGGSPAELAAVGWFRRVPAAVEREHARVAGRHDPILRTVPRRRALRR